MPTDPLDPLDPLKTLRRICMALPEATERLSHGEPAWFVGKGRCFATSANHHHDERVAFWCAAPEGAQETLMTVEPERYFVPPYVGHRGWLGVYLDVLPVDWNEIAERVAEAYREMAPAKLVAAMKPAPRRGVSRAGRPRTRR